MGYGEQVSVMQDPALRKRVELESSTQTLIRFPARGTQGQQASERFNGIGRFDIAHHHVSRTRSLGDGGTQCRQAPLTHKPYAPHARHGKVIKCAYGNAQIERTRSPFIVQPFRRKQPPLHFMHVNS